MNQEKIVMNREEAVALRELIQSKCGLEESHITFERSVPCGDGVRGICLFIDASVANDSIRECVENTVSAYDSRLKCWFSQSDIKHKGIYIYYAEKKASRP